MSRVALFEKIRRGRRQGASIRGLADTHGVHRRTVRQAIAGAMPPERKTPVRDAAVLGPWKDTIRGWLRADLEVPRKQRHTARRVWERLVSEHDPEVRTAMSELAVGTVEGSPLFDQREDRVGFSSQQPVGRVPARHTILEGARRVEPAPPAVHPHVGHPQGAARPGVGPPGGYGVGEESQQLFFDLAAETGRDLGEGQAQRAYPRSNADSIAGSLIASVSRAASSWSASI